MGMETCIEGRELLLQRLTHQAIEHNYTDALAALIRYGADPNATTPEGLTLLMIAALYDRPHAIHILLTTPQADPNGRDQAGTTALMLAAERGHPHCVQQLLSAPAINIGAQDIACDTALDRAHARFKQTGNNGNQRCIALIEEYHARQKQCVFSSTIAACKELLWPSTPTHYCGSRMPKVKVD